MSVTFVAARVTKGLSAVGPNIKFPILMPASGIQANDLLVMAVTNPGTTGPTMTLIGRALNAGNAELGMWWRRAGGWENGATSQVPFRVAGTVTAQDYIGIVCQYRGVPQLSSVAEAVSGVDNNGTNSYTWTLDPGALGAAVQERVFAVGADATVVTHLAAGVTERAFDTQGANLSLGMYDYLGATGTPTGWTVQFDRAAGAMLTYVEGGAFEHDASAPSAGGDSYDSWGTE